ncbi:hypothetical protein [Streptomyces sp. NBC_01497]|uniref:hypothetical protein n=1 Tax=Streptomyces sp. NBC_01497 TaxID=2903885 RepID=UPI002E357781|nr:hypothetical protein [Streptomyces sp. NBC_01497]
MARALDVRDGTEAEELTSRRFAIAWVAAQGQDFTPLVGARARAQLADVLDRDRAERGCRGDRRGGEAVSRGVAAGDRYMRTLLDLLGREP